jgi:hypothetical protein
VVCRYNRVLGGVVGCADYIVDGGFMLLFESFVCVE